METFTIGKLAKKAEISIETVRYYERRGLVSDPLRSEVGYRQYSNDDVIRIKFIKHAKELGFSLKEISELLNLQMSSENTCSNVKKQAEVKLDDIEKKIKSLQQMKKTLKKLIASCSNGNNSGNECPILDALRVGKK